MKFDAGICRPIFLAALARFHEALPHKALRGGREILSSLRPAKPTVFPRSARAPKNIFLTAAMREPNDVSRRIRGLLAAMRPSAFGASGDSL
jgi:hypothetical protein